MFTSPTVIWSDVMMQEPRLFSRRRKRTRQRLPYATKPPWGVCVFLEFQSYAAFRPRVWPWLLNAASPNSATVQDQRLGSPLVFDTIFSIFCLTVMGNVWKHGLCDFERPGACWISLTDGSVSSNDCCPRLTQMEDAGGKMAVVKSLYSRPVSGLERKTNSVSHTCVSVILRHGISCLFMLFGCTHAVFLFLLVAMPSLTSVYSWKRTLNMQDIQNKTVSRKEEEKLKIT